MVCRIAIWSIKWIKNTNVAICYFFAHLEIKIPLQFRQNKNTVNTKCRPLNSRSIVLKSECSTKCNHTLFSTTQYLAHEGRINQSSIFVHIYVNSTINKDSCDQCFHFESTILFTREENMVENDQLFNSYDFSICLSSQSFQR